MRHSRTSCQFINGALPRQRASQGFSLVEVLLIISMLSLIIIPYTLVMTQTAQGSRGSYIQSTRSILLNSLLDEMSPERTAYYARFHDSSMNTSTSESGQTIPYMRKVDVTNSGASTALKRTTNIYLYNNSSDANTAYRYKTKVIQAAKSLRLRTGGSTSLIDSSNMLWQPASSTYDSTYKVPGPISGSYSIDNTCPNIVNTTGNDDTLYCSYYYYGNMTYSIDVDNGPYTVKLYFAETYNAINATTSRRLWDITIEGTQMTKSPYSAYEATGGTARAQVKMYDVNVTDGTLNINLAQNAASNDPNAFINAIQIIKRAY